MSGNQDSAEKEFAPTPKKLEDARKKGEVPRSTDINTAAGYGGLLVAGFGFGSFSISLLGAEMAGLLSNAPELGADVFAGGSTAFAGGVGQTILGAMLPWFLIPMVLVVLSTIAQRSMIFAPDKLRPKVNRISPLSNAKNKFGRQGLFEFAKSTTKLTIFCAILGLFLLIQNDRIMGSVHLDAMQVAVQLGEICLDFLMIVFAISFCIGLVDFGWQYAEHIRKNRMTRQEMMDEAKQSEGDPQMRGRRRRRAQEIATQSMLADVADASVVIVNPTHYATALKWQRHMGSAPICVAKGTDEIARRIREKADEHGIPIFHDPPTARAIHAVVEVGQEIHPDHYRAVAAAIRFAEAMRQRAKSGWNNR